MDRHLLIFQKPPASGGFFCSGNLWFNQGLPEQYMEALIESKQSLLLKPIPKTLLIDL